MSAPLKRSHSAPHPGSASSNLAKSLDITPVRDVSVRPLPKKDPQRAPSANIEPGEASSSTTARGHEYRPPTGTLCRVFVSHAGELKRGYVAFLRQEFMRSHPALEVFVDEHSLTMGASAMRTIEAALADAYVVVVVLSKEFISKKYPMEELGLLLQWQRQGSPATLLPVFHGVSCEEVGETAAEYEAATCDLQKQQWARDLRGVLGITGARPDQVANSMEPGLVALVVGRVVEALVGRGQMPSRGVEEPGIKVGMDSSRERLVGLLAGGSGRHMVLLHGMGGIGKTTLARAVLNQLHERNPTVPCCLVSMHPDMEEAAIMQKQQQLLQELVRVKGDDALHSAEGGRQLLEQHLEGKSVMLVVDNVWGDVLELLLPGDFMQLLGEGSMVLVTSREQGAARKMQRVTDVEMQYLSDGQSLELFCRHAFPGLAPVPSSWQEHVHQSQWASQILAVLKMCAGLPMALEVLGKYFAECHDRAKFHTLFQEACLRQNAGRKEGERTLFGALRLSWSILEPEEQEALLDIAWFLKGERWYLVQHHCGSSIVGRLCALGLLKQQYPSSKNAQVAALHDTVSFFCSDAAAIGRPPERKRLGTSSELQRQDAASSSLKGLSLFWQEVEEAALLGQTELRVLRMTNSSFILGGWAAIFPWAWPLGSTLSLSLHHLRWLHLVGDMSGERSLVLQDMPSLAVLHLQWCRQLRGVELRSCPGLRVAKAIRCRELRKVDVGGATALEHLSIVDSGRLKVLSGLEHLGALRSLHVAYCHDLTRLDVGGVTALEELRVHLCGELQRVDGLEGLRALRSFAVEVCCELKRLDLGGLAALEELSIELCWKLQAVDGLGGLRALRSMRVDNCEKLERLDLGGLGALRQLEMCEPCGQLSQNGLSRLGALTSLKVKCQKQVPMLDLRGLTALQELQMQGWECLQEVVGPGELCALRLWTMDLGDMAGGFVDQLSEQSAESLVAHLEGMGIECSSHPSDVTTASLERARKPETPSSHMPWTLEASKGWAYGGYEPPQFIPHPTTTFYADNLL